MVTSRKRRAKDQTLGRDDNVTGWSVSALVVKDPLRHVSLEIEGDFRIASHQAGNAIPKGATIVVQPARYVTVALAAKITGRTEKSLRRKIEDGKWIEGREYRRDPDGGINIDTKGIERWVEATA